MRRLTTSMGSARRRLGAARLASGLLLAFFAGCGTTKNAATTSTAATQSGPQLYFAPGVVGAVGSDGNNGLSTFSIDDAADVFQQTTYLLESQQVGPQQGAQVLNAGIVAAATRGLRSLGITATYTPDVQVNPHRFDPTYYNPPLPGSFALELASRTGGLVQLAGQPAQPLVAATACPSFATPQAYQFITIPAALAQPNQSPYNPGTWDPATETAYGSVDIVSSGGAVAFQNIQQFTLLPSAGGKPSFPAASSVNGLCGSTFFGDTVSVPGQLAVNPDGSVPYEASIGIGASGGLMVEANSTIQRSSSTGLPYENALGAGTGAVGLPVPSSPLSTSGIVGAQYLGFIYAAGVSGGLTWSSNLASFGFEGGAARGCAGLPQGTATSVSGGDFNPTTSPDGYGNCDFSIDLKAQNPSRNGLYDHAAVSISGAYPGMNGVSETFNAVAIAGQIGGKYAILAIGVDTVQPWAIYLLQSN